jgi:hypothetical protein
MRKLGLGRKLLMVGALVGGILGAAVSDAFAIQCDYDVLVLVEGKSRGYAVLPNLSSECAFVSAVLPLVLNSSPLYLKVPNMSSVCARINMENIPLSTVTWGPCMPVVKQPVDATDGAKPIAPSAVSPLK